MLFSLGFGIGMLLLLLVMVGSCFLFKFGFWMNLVKGVFGFFFFGIVWIFLCLLFGEVLWIGFGGVLLLVLVYVVLYMV